MPLINRPSVARHRFALLGAINVALTICAPLQAQQAATMAPDPARAAAEASLAECSTQIERGAVADALTTGKRAESQFHALIARNGKDPDLLVGLARAVSQCLLPSGDFA